MRCRHTIKELFLIIRRLAIDVELDMPVFRLEQQINQLLKSRDRQARFLLSPQFVDGIEIRYLSDFAMAICRTI